MVGLFAQHFVFGERRIGENIEKQLHAIDKCLFEKTRTHLQRIAVSEGAKRSSQAIDIVLDVRCATGLRTPVPNRGQESDQARLIDGFHPLPAVQHGTHGDERCFAIGLHDELAVAGQLNHRELGRRIRGDRVVIRGLRLNGRRLFHPSQNRLAIRQGHALGHQHGNVGPLQVKEFGGNAA